MRHYIARRVPVNDPDGDFLARSTLSGIRYEQNFATYTTDAELRASAHGGGANHPANRTLETRAGVSGKCCRLWIRNTNGEGSTDYRVSFDGKEADTKNTILKRFSAQWHCWPDPYLLDHRFRTDSNNTEPADNTNNASWKWVIIQEPDVSFTTGEIVVTNMRQRGFATAYRWVDDAPTTRGFSVDQPGVPGIGTDLRLQNAVEDPSVVVTDNASARRRYGLMLDSWELGATTNYGTPLSQQGNPEAESAVNGVPWVPGAWNVVEVFIDANAQIFQMWHAVRGNAPKLVHSYIGNANIGQRADNYTGMQFVPRMEQCMPDATRLDTFWDLAEPLVREDLIIPYPGGFLPPGAVASV